MAGSLNHSAACHGLPALYHHACHGLLLLEIDYPPLVMDYHPLAIDYEPLVLDYQPLAIDYQLLAIDYQSLAMGYCLLMIIFVHHKNNNYNSYIIPDNVYTE